MEIQENVSLARYATFGVGGNVRWLVRVKGRDDISSLIHFIQEKKLPFFILGGGSNILVSDDFFHGVVVKMEYSEISYDGNRVRVAAGTHLAFCARETAQRGLSGLEWGFGIPGTVGGAVRGNAGCFSVNMSDVVTTVEVYDITRGLFLVMTQDELEYSYRKSIFHTQSHLIIVNAVFQLRTEKPEECLSRLYSYYDQKKLTQPLGVRCAGSVFKNPTLEGLTASKEIPLEWLTASCAPAGYLIEKVNMKGHCIGGATVSPKHANFIVNTGTATSKDIQELISLIKERVHNFWGLTLEEEIQYIK